MVDQPVTREKLINADKDVQVIEDFIKKSKDETVTTRFGDQITTLKGLEEMVKKSGGYFKRYTSLAAANADIANIPVNAVIKVTSEVDGGDYEKETGGATTLTKSPYDPLEQAKADATTKANVAKQSAVNQSVGKHSAIDEGIGVAITDKNGNLTWLQVDTNGLAPQAVIDYLRHISKLKIHNSNIYNSEGEKIGVAISDSAGNLTALHVRESDGMFTDAVIRNIGERLEIQETIPMDFRTYDKSSNINILRSVSAGIIRHINEEALPPSTYDFIDSSGQGGRVMLPTDYNDATPIPLIIEFGGAGSTSGSEGPSLNSAFLPLLGKGFALAKSRAHGRSYGSPAAMQSYLEVFQKACEIAPIGAVIFIGVSMGGIAAQNALLTNTIPNVSGLYLIDTTYDLRQRYDNGRKTDITEAYNIASDGSDYYEKTAGYDPSKRHWSHYRGLPIRIVASSGDTGVPMASHGQKLKNYLADHNDIVLIDKGTPGHSTPDRYDAEDIADFIQNVLKIEVSS